MKTAKVLLWTSMLWRAARRLRAHAERNWLMILLILLKRCGSTSGRWLARAITKKVD